MTPCHLFSVKQAFPFPQKKKKKVAHYVILTPPTVFCLAFLRGSNGIFLFWNMLCNSIKIHIHNRFTVPSNLQRFLSLALLLKLHCCVLWAFFVVVEFALFLFPSQLTSLKQRSWLWVYVATKIVHPFGRLCILSALVVGSTSWNRSW